MAPVLVLVLVGTASADDGYFFEESIGGAGYRGELARYGGGAPRFQFGVGVRRGAWTVTGFGGALVPDFYAIDCYGEEECAAFEAPKAGLGTAGVDIRKRWRLLSLARWGRPGVYERPGVFVGVRGGARWFFGYDALDGVSGPGIGGAASLEGDLWVLGYFVDLGIDVMRLQGPEGTIRGSTPYLMFGAKLGWL